MKTLQTIQKTFRVFQVLTKIAFIFSIVGASLCGVGVLCVIAESSGGQVLSLFGEPLSIVSGNLSLNQMLGVMFSELVMLVAEAILLGFAGQYFKTEQAEGTPFGQKGAEQIKKLGIRCIYLPIVAIVIATSITTTLGVERSGDVSNLPSVIMGIILILASLIFRYGAELEQKES